MFRYENKIATLTGVFVVVGISYAGCSAIMGIDDECDNAADCASMGTNLACREHLCVHRSEDDDNTGDSTDDKGTDLPTGLDLLGGPCTRVDGVDDPSETIPQDAIVIGSILPLSGELSIAGVHFDQVTLLATEEINRAGGIFGRKLIKVGCDSGSSPVTAREAAEHLRDIGVQAVLGPFASEIVLSVYSDVLRDAGMMVVSAGANAPIISTVSAEGLIWSTSMPASREAKVMAEHLLRSSWNRVAVIHRSDTWGDSMFNAFYSVYCSGDGVDCTDDDVFLVRAYDTSDLATSMSSVVAELSAWQPDVTVSFSYIDDALTFLTIVGATGAPLTSLVWNNVIASELVFSLLDPALLPVLCQVQVTTQQMPGGIVYGSYITRYRARFDGQDPVPYTAAFYDAAYLLAYAYAAASSDENPNPTGEEIARAMGRLSSGTPVEAGAEDWNVGIMALRTSEESNIDYVGASGDLNFSGGTGTIVCPVEAVRFNVGEKSIDSLGLIYSNEDVYTPPNYADIDADPVCGDAVRP